MKYFNLNMTMEQAERRKKDLLSRFHPDRSATGNEAKFKEVCAEFGRFKIVREELDAAKRRPADPRRVVVVKPRQSPPSLADNFVNFVNKIDFDQMERAAGLLGRLFDAFSSEEGGEEGREVKY